MTDEPLKTRQAEHEWVNRLKADPKNVAAQLIALTQISDWARVTHRDNFDGYLIAAAELLSARASIADEPSEARIEAGVRALEACRFHETGDAKKVAEVWRAMTRAAEPQGAIIGEGM